MIIRNSERFPVFTYLASKTFNINLQIQLNRELKMIQRNEKKYNLVKKHNFYWKFTDKIAEEFITESVKDKYKELPVFNTYLNKRNYSSEDIYKSFNECSELKVTIINNLCKHLKSFLCFNKKTVKKLLKDDVEIRLVKMREV